MYEEVDIREVRKDLKRKFNINSEIIHSDLVNGLGINNIFVDCKEYEDIEVDLIKISDYIQEEYECFCEYITSDKGYEVIFNIY